MATVTKKATGKATTAAKAAAGAKAAGAKAAGAKAAGAKAATGAKATGAKATGAKATGAKAAAAAKTKAKAKAKAKTKTKGEPALPRAAARAALDQATAAIKKLQKDAARNFWGIGRRLAQVAELKLHQARGFASLEEYADRVLRLSRGAAFQYMRVAQAFSEEVAATFGPEKLDRALAYIAATPADEKPSDVPTLAIEVPGEDGAAAKKKPFADVTVAELRRATQGVKAGAACAAGKGGTAKKDGGVPDAVAAAVATANKALDGAVGRAAAKGADVQVRAAGGGAFVVEVRGVPLERAAAAFRALATALK